MSEEQQPTEQVIEVSPEAVEAALVEKEQEQQKVELENHNPEDIAAAFFKMNYQRLAQQLDKLSLRQLKRLVIQIAATPFVPAPYKPRTKEETQAAYTFGEMVMNKTVMQLAFERQRAEQAMQKEAEAKKSAELSVEENKGEEVNGTTETQN